MPQSSVRVVKVGGSLFELPDMKDRLHNWLATQSKATCVLIAGGGKVVESIREVDAVHRLGETASHWLCVQAMSVTARLLVDLMEDAALVDELSGLRELLAARPGHTCVFDVVEFLQRWEPSLDGAVLPHTWSVTSDSIAARLAQVLRADELVLLKSALPPDSRLRAMAEADYVDDFFPTIAQQLPQVRIINLRDDEFGETIAHAS